MTNDVTVVEQLLQSSYDLFKTSSTPEKKNRNSMESQLVGRSPITLALMNNDFEIDFINEIEGKKLNHMRLVEELKTIEISNLRTP
jgi:DNA-dependent RNA polymerase auxiliary subunit epsilon